VADSRAGVRSVIAAGPSGDVVVTPSKVVADALSDVAAELVATSGPASPPATVITARTTASKATDERVRVGCI